jgi:hypothetical protein
MANIIIHKGAHTGPEDNGAEGRNGSSRNF